MQTEIKLLLKDEYLNLQVKPTRQDSTKVTMWVTGSKDRQDVILENKNYRGTLQEEAASFRFDHIKANI